jgi:hypothetical protein
MIGGDLSLNPYLLEENFGASAPAGLIAVLRYAADDSADLPARVQNLPSTRAFRATRFALNHSCL